MSHHQDRLPYLEYKPTPEALQLKNNPSHTTGLREQQFPKRMLGKHNNSYHESLHASRSWAWKVCMARTPCSHTMEMTSVSSLRRKRKAIRKPETTKSILGAKYEANTCEA